MNLHLKDSQALLINSFWKRNHRSREMLWIIEGMESMILVFIIVMILWLNCFEGNWNVRGPEENVCLCDSCRPGESVFHLDQE